MSPNYPCEYDEDTVYNWTFNTYPGRFLAVKFHDFDLEENSDYVSIMIVGDEVGRYTGSDTPSITTSSTNELTVIFQSDERGTRKGFEAEILVLGAREGFCSDFEDGFSGWFDPRDTVGFWAAGQFERSSEGNTRFSVYTGHSASSDNYYVHANITSNEISTQYCISSPEIPEAWSQFCVQLYYHRQLTYRNNVQFSHVYNDSTQTKYIHVDFDQTVWNYINWTFSNNNPPNFFQINALLVNQYDILAVDDIYISKGNCSATDTTTITTTPAYSQQPVTKAECSGSTTIKSSLVSPLDGENMTTSGNYSQPRTTDAQGIVQITLQVDRPEVVNVSLMSEEYSVTFSTSAIDTLEEDGPFRIVASLTLLKENSPMETINEEVLPSVTDIVDISIYDKNQKNLINVNSKIQFPIIKDTKGNLILVCHHTPHFTQDTPTLWSPNGCETVYDDYRVSGATCKCNHLTSFVILMKPKQIKENRNLSVITTVGLAISSFFLIITLVIIRSFRCWLDTRSRAIWAFIAPVCLTLLIVLIQLMITGYVAFKKSKVPNLTRKETEKLKQIRTLFAGMLLLTPAVGLSWIFGVIIVFCHSEMMEYVFVFINSMQGFYIWLTQCALSGEVQLALKKRFKNRTGHDISINTISSTTNTNRVTIEEL
ncbi:uncharacterized protein LOC117103622 [Anneissia japonica]|uniref:uncharacterized protein LOC117103622 n=2 Tax=Anneissia japonica TaxID=1529436 RepID=UPI001425B91C|nr:uncharacterized protein LOC117103622 [Anneissia japonica]